LVAAGYGFGIKKCEWAGDFGCLPVSFKKGGCKA